MENFKFYWLEYLDPKGVAEDIRITASSDSEAIQIARRWNVGGNIVLHLWTTR